MNLEYKPTMFALAAAVVLVRVTVMFQTMTDTLYHSVILRANLLVEEGKMSVSILESACFFEIGPCSQMRRRFFSKT